MTDGIVVIDKPVGMTSHDVVSRLRRCLGIRRIGHAGTLDPDASGVLVLGVGKATRLLTYLVGDDKDYDAVIRLGASTITDDAAGEVIAQCSPEELAAVTDATLRANVRRLTGEIAQRPSAVSAVKVDGQRSYARVRAGEEVALPTRRVRVERFDVLDVHRGDGVLDVSVSLTVSSGTYVRALARDLGQACAVGGHVRSLRRTRSGSFTAGEAQPLPALGDSVAVTPLADAMGRSLPVLEVNADQAAALAHGRRIALASLGETTGGTHSPDELLSLGQAAVDSEAGAAGLADGAVVGAVSSDGRAIAICRRHADELAPDIVFA